MCGSSLHNKCFTYDGCGADTIFTIQKQNKKQNNLFTFQQFTNNNNIHYN